MGRFVNGSSSSVAYGTSFRDDLRHSVDAFLVMFLTTTNNTPQYRVWPPFSYFPGVYNATGIRR